MAYKSNITINETLLKNATFSIGDNSLSIQHVGIPELNLQGGMIIELGIVSLMMYPTACVVKSEGDTVIVDLWANTDAKKKHPFRKKKKETVPSKTGRNNFTVG